MLSIKNFKQKRSSKKLTHKFVGFFRIKDKIETQTYRLTLSIIYRIHNIFHVSFLKVYHHKNGLQQADAFMQISKFINDEKMWKIKKIVDRAKSKGHLWYKIKWMSWNEKYNQWILKNELDNAFTLKKKYDEQAFRKRKKSSKPNFQKHTLSKKNNRNSS